MNTIIEYLYRDADNYKVPNVCVVQGEVTEQQIETIINSLDEGAYFIPSKVGLPEKRFADFDPEVDHKWFELGMYGFSDTDLPATVNIKAAELVDRFARRAGRWEADEPDKGVRPYIVAVTEISRREVIVWANGTAVAESAAKELWNNSDIVLDDSDFVERQFECSREAAKYDQNKLPQFGKTE